MNGTVLSVVYIMNLLQFLLYNDFNATLPIFIEEAVTLDYRLSEEQLIRVDHIKRENIQQLLSAFNLSNHISFFKVSECSLIHQLIGFLKTCTYRL